MIKKFFIIFSIIIGVKINCLDEHCKSWGEYSYGTVNAWPRCNQFFTVGKFCSLAGVSIFLHGNHRTDWITTYPFPEFKDKFPEAASIKDYIVSKGNVFIGNDVWIGTNVLILSGVTIGDGAIIAAHSIVTKNIPPYALAAGNPAQIKKFRFDQKTIEHLLKIKWWDWPIEKIKRNIHLICSNNINKFIEKHSTKINNEKNI